MPATPEGGGLDLLFPLNLLHAADGVPLPQVERVDGDAVPEPYRQLLVHERDMTPTLARFHDDAIGLRVTVRESDGETLLREVVLTRARDSRPVEFGAILIHLGRFDAPARADIVAGRIPLGTILAAHRVAHLSCPQAFVRVRSCPLIDDRLELPRGPHVLYGRRNLLATPGREPLAEILEILPPDPPKEP